MKRVKEDKDNINYSKAFASAFKTILSCDLDGSPTWCAPILAEKKEILDQLQLERQNHKITRRRVQEKRFKEKEIHIKDVEFESLHEMQMKKLATRGIVRLFNSIVVAKQRRCMGESCK